VLLDAQRSLLLLYVRDSSRPEMQPWWELPGGGCEEGESPGEVAARELAEETGLIIDSAQISTPRWHRSCTYLHRGRRVLQHEMIVVAHIAESAPALLEHARTPTEVQDIIGFRWWAVPDLGTGTERFFPGTLPEHINALLAGQVIHEDLEVWE